VHRGRPFRMPGDPMPSIEADHDVEARSKKRHHRPKRMPGDPLPDIVEESPVRRVCMIVSSLWGSICPRRLDYSL
jgi:hypothetical protein